MKGIVVAPQPRASEVGVRVLEQGGSAFDASIAASFMQMVTDPFMCGVGGMGTAQVYVAATGKCHTIVFHGRAGSLVNPGMWASDIQGRTPVSGYTLFDDYRSEIGYTSIMTPGTVAGYGEIHRRFATLPWRQLLAPAIAACRDGIRAPTYLVDFLRRPLQTGVPNGHRRISTTVDCAKLYLDSNGDVIQEGALLRNPDMASVLETLACLGPRSFYEGSLGEMIAEDLANNGSYVTRQDLSEYSIRSGTPITVAYRDCTVSSNLPPGGGPWLLEALNILEGFTLSDMEHNGPEFLHVLASAMELAHSDRDTYLGDPDFVNVPLKTIFLSKDHALKLRESIKGNQRTPDYKGRSIPSETTHLSVVDGEGNIVTVTHTLGTSSGVITKGLGFMYNNSMKLADPIAHRPNSIAPGKARITGMCPTIVFKGNSPILIAGAPGGNVIMSAVLQTIINVIDFNMTATEAVSAPRIHAEGGMVYVEHRIREDTCEMLIRMGHRVDHLMQSYAADFSRPQIVKILNDGSLDGGSDPRGGGGLAYSRS